MKKIISLIAAAAVMMSFTSAFADNNADELQKVLVSVKPRVGVTDGYTEFTSRSFATDSGNSYMFNWSTEDGDKNISVTAYEDGVITSYNSYERSDGYNGPKMASMSAEDAKAIAEAFEEQINPDYPYETEIFERGSASLYDGVRNFGITVYINGVPLNETGSIGVDTVKGTVTSYSVWYDPAAAVDFESADAFIGADAAKNAYKEKLGMELVYSSFYDYDSDKLTFYPAYVQKSSYGRYINALTGEVEDINRNYSVYSSGGGATANMKAEDALESGLSPREIEEIDNINGLISKADIEKQIKDNKTLAVPSDMKAERVNLYKDTSEDTYFYNISMTSSDKDNAVYVRVTANAKTGEIISFSMSRDYDVNEKDIEYTYQNDDILKALAGGKSGEFTYNEATSSYDRYVNGARVERDGAYMTLTNGVLTNYNITYSNVEFPSIDDAMTADEAADAFFAQMEYKPMCMETYRGDGAHIVPVYAYEGSYTSVNPFTGKLIDWRNREVTGAEDEPLSYSDISGHYAESYINALAEYGIGFEGGSFKPDEKITQSDLLTLLTFVSGGESVIVRYGSTEQIDAAYARAAAGNIISENERADDAVITRETASIYLIRAIGAEEYAKYDDIYVTPYADVTENKGYIALLTAMGVVKGDDSGSFNPKREITRAEFAVMLYNYLNR